LEGAFIFLVLFRPWKIPSSDLLPTTHSPYRYALPAAALLLIVSISILTYRWDVSMTQSYGYHVSSLDQVKETPAISIADLEQEYGIQVVQAGTSMMDSIVDVRIRILDRDKAHALLQNQTALLVGDQTLVLAPHMHSHTSTRLKPGKVFIVFFPTEQIIHRGSEVSLVFGPIRTEPVIVK
jgi:hypothetical protein